MIAEGWENVLYFRLIEKISNIKGQVIVKDFRFLIVWLHWIVYLLLVYTYTNISHCFPKNYLVFVFIVHLDIVLGLVKWGLSGGGGTDLRTACSNQVEVSTFDCFIKEETKSHISRWFQFCIWASAALDLHPDWFWHSNMLKLHISFGFADWPGYFEKHWAKGIQRVVRGQRCDM